MRHDPLGHAVFEGVVSLERGEGFASVRSSAGPRGMAGAAMCVVEARGDGRRYKLNRCRGLSASLVADRR
jgi:hypothetical protein